MPGRREGCWPRMTQMSTDGLWVRPRRSGWKHVPFESCLLGGAYTIWACTNGSQYAIGKSLAEFRRGIPANVVQLLGIKMGLIKAVFAAGADHRNAQSTGEARLKVDSVAVPGEVRDNKWSTADTSQHLVHDVLIMFDQIDTRRLVSSILNGRADA